MASGMQEILDAREARWLRRLELCRRGTVATVTLNVPGPDKADPVWVDAHRRLCGALERELERFAVVHRESRVTPAGAESHFVLQAEASTVKEAAVRFEEEHPAGRLVDVDVMDAGGCPVGRELLGLPPRACLCCALPARECAAGRSHPLDEVLARAREILRAAFGGDR